MLPLYRRDASRLALVGGLAAFASAAPLRASALGCAGLP